MRQGLRIAAFGGPLGIRWDEDAKATWWGGLSYFATFLKVSRMFDRLVEDAKGRRWDFFALVTNDTELEPVALTQLYRDRGDCENNFDEYTRTSGDGADSPRASSSRRARPHVSPR